MYSTLYNVLYIVRVQTHVHIIMHCVLVNVYRSRDCTVCKLQNLYCTCTLNPLLDMHNAIFPKNSNDSILLKTQLEIAKIELNEKFSLLSKKLSIKKFVLTNSIIHFLTNYYNFH